MQPPADLIPRFEAAFGVRPEIIARAPGRVDVIGAHTDYNDGLVLPAAIDRSVWVAARQISGSHVTIHSLDMDERVSFDLLALDAKQALDGRPLPEWARYPAGVAWALKDVGADLPGCEIAVTGDVPVGAGLSSSAAIEVAHAVMWAYLSGWEGDRMALAQLCQRAENIYVGVNSGLMDQFSSAFGQADHALLFDCRTLFWEAVPLSQRVALVIADTGTRRTLSTSRYNERRAECEQAVRALQTVLPGIQALRDVPVEIFHQVKEVIPQPARDRAQHVIEEIDRVRQAAESLKQGNVEALGKLMDESQISARDLYAASGPDIDAMWEASLGHPARLGGRFLGAGWAGCLIFLVEAAGAQDFMAATGRRYQQRTGRVPDLYATRAAQGAEIGPLPEMS